MNRLQISNAINNICRALPWLSECAKSIDITNIGDIHSLLIDVSSSCEKFSDYKDKWLEDRKVKRKSR